VFRLDLSRVSAAAVGSRASDLASHRQPGVPLSAPMTERPDARTGDSRHTPPRPPCPVCGSLRTQPFTHAGPVARVNMKCTNCGHLFKSPKT